MANNSMPSQVTALPQDQQKAIEKVLSEVGLIKSPGDNTKFSMDSIPPKNKAAMEAMGIGNSQELSFNIGCVAARIAEAAAVAACATIPGGQIAIAACIAAAHELANKACE